jgi:hypothetical protein
MKHPNIEAIDTEPPLHLLLPDIILTRVLPLMIHCNKNGAWSHLITIGLSKKSTRRREETTGPIERNDASLKDRNDCSFSAPLLVDGAAGFAVMPVDLR